MVYRETIEAGEKPTSEILSQILGCLQLPYDTSVKNRLVENLGVSMETSRSSKLCSLMDGFGEYDPRAFSILEVSMELKLILFSILCLIVSNGTWTIIRCCNNCVGICFTRSCSICIP